ncbi:10323_t:CDS:10 [Ambispora leptoticha]|uniref:10323_t:CDS:1 n=1 Tax=Ambispora leptoticha TaxID=144679 RepID=A0A9N9G269_9GLOM|nr:10323_t:CDS:10 [Ambispora leptoticha]
MFKAHEDKEIYDYDDEISDVKMNFSNEEKLYKWKAFPFNAWILSTGKNVSQVLENFRSTIPKSKAYLYPAFFGTLDLSGKKDKPEEINNSGGGNIITTSNEEKRQSQEEMLYDLFDKIQEKPDDLIKAIEKCTIEFVYDEGEIQSIASAFVIDSMKKPTDRSLIGQKCDFRITCDGFEMDIELRSGRLSVQISSNYIQLGSTLMVRFPGKAHYQLFTMDWKSRGLWRLGLLKKTNLPQSNSQLLIIEKLVVTLLRLELTLNHIESIRNDLAVKASRLHRKRHTSIINKQ